MFSMKYFSYVILIIGVSILKTSISNPTLQFTNLKNKTHRNFSPKFFIDLPQECISEHYAIDDFPDDIFTQEQREAGWIVVHLAISVYIFLVLALICENYFVPSLGYISMKFNLSEDVSGATLMAIGSSAPTVFIALISVFLVENATDIGVGTIVGSTIFNTLFIIGSTCLSIPKPMTIMWYPLLRDTVAYLTSTSVLIVSVSDGSVYWWESLIFIIVYTLYIIVIVNNSKVEIFAHKIHDKIFNKQAPINIKKEENATTINTINIKIGHAPADGTNIDEIVNDDAVTDDAVTGGAVTDDAVTDGDVKDDTGKDGAVTDSAATDDDAKDGAATDDAVTDGAFTDGAATDDDVKDDTGKDDAATDDDVTDDTGKDGTGGVGLGQYGTVMDDSLENATVTKSTVHIEATELTIVKFPCKCFDRIKWIFGIFVVLLFDMITPKCVQEKNPLIYYSLRFLISIGLLGMFSYILVWMVCIIGYTMSIPDCVMGMTFLAAGSSLPDVMASIVVSRNGNADMAIANAVGSNVFDMLCLGLPWFIKSTMITPGIAIEIQNQSTTLSTTLLIGSMLYTLTILYLNQWKLSKKMGYMFLTLYFSLIFFATIIEMLQCPCDLHL